MTVSKYTAVAHTHPAFCSLRRTCQCAEPHEPWGRNSSAPNGWATSLETSCGGYRSVFHGILQSSCACPWTGLASAQSRCRHAAQRQQISTVGSTAVVPADAQFLRCTSHPDKQGSVEFVFGIPWSPSQFVMQAVAAGHPCAMQAALPEVLRSAIAWNAKTSEHEASAFRNMWFQKWLRRALELRASKKRLKASLDGDVASILRGKRLCLWNRCFMSTVILM